MNTIHLIVSNTNKTPQQPATIFYHFASFPFGDVLIASTNEGVCWIGFYHDKEKAVQNLSRLFPSASLHHQESHFISKAKEAINDPSTEQALPLIVSGTAFQVAIWQALLAIPFGTLTTYAAVAESIQNPKAVRAVGTAIGRNPVAILIPCHRVVASQGGLGGYFWGLETKQKLIEWETSILNTNKK